MLKKILTSLLVLITVTAVGAWAFWPANWVVSGPVLDFLTGNQVQAPSEDTLQRRFHLPEGFKIGLFAENIPHARMMAVSPAGDIAVSSMREGTIILLHRDANMDGQADGRTILLTGLDVPHGLAFQGGYLYVAETHQIIRVPYNTETRTAGLAEVIFAGLPPGGNHRTRTLGFGPDGWLYVTVGSSCNVCIEHHPYRAAMLRMQADGSHAAVYATGLRNTVGFDWQPHTGKLYGTDNARDLLGDDIPNCEINLIEEEQFYGWPYSFDQKAVDPDLGKGREAIIARSRPMVHGLGGHVAPLGIRFLKPDMVPAGYEGAALVALHGSWNRSQLSGYKVISLHFGAGGMITEKDFLTGFEQGGDVIGRPVDIIQGPDGALYISDDYAGSIYRVGWEGHVVAGMASSSMGTAKPAGQSPLAEIAAKELSRLQQEGAVLFQDNGCRQCHEPGPEGGAPAVKIMQGLAVRRDFETVIDILNFPPSSMPRPDLTPDEQRALAVYLLSQSLLMEQGPAQ